MIKPTVYTGTFIHTPSLGGLEVLANKAVGVDKDGVIRFIEDCPEANDDKIAFIETIFQHMGLQVEDFGEWEYVRGRSGKRVERWWFPGFVGEIYFLLYDAGDSCCEAIRLASSSISRIPRDV